MSQPALSAVIREFITLARDIERELQEVERARESWERRARSLESEIDTLRKTLGDDPCAAAGRHVCGSGHDEGERTPLVADISLWKFLRATGVPPMGATESDADRAFDRIIRGAQDALRLADALREIAAYADDFPGSEPLQRVRDMAMEAVGDS